MESLVTRIGVALAANTVALLAAWLLLDGVHVRVLFFVFLVVEFTIVSLVATWGIRSLVAKYARSLAPFASLAATFVTLLVTDLLSASLTIDGVLTWVFATLIVWAATLVVQYLAPLIIRDRQEAAGRIRRGEPGPPPI